MFEIEPGTKVGVRPNWSLGALFGSPPTADILQGDSVEEADVIGLQDPATQTTREFFFKSGEGWREVGHEEEGDRSATAVPYRSAVQFFRRTAPDLSFVQVGTVPMYDSPQHWVKVWPGRNLLTTPFSPAKKIGELLVPASLVSGGSAPHSDSFRVVSEDAELSPIIYHHQSRGWTSVGGGATPAAETPFDLYTVLDFQRVGEVGFLRFNTDFLSNQSVSGRLSVAEQVVPIDPELSDFTSQRLGWRSEPGATYQVQVRPLESSLWNDLGAPVVADGEVTLARCAPEGRGIFRIVVR